MEIPEHVCNNRNHKNRTLLNRKIKQVFFLLLICIYRLAYPVHTTDLSRERACSMDRVLAPSIGLAAGALRDRLMRLYKVVIHNQHAMEGNVSRFRDLNKDLTELC